MEGVPAHFDDQQSVVNVKFKVIDSSDKCMFPATLAHGYITFVDFSIKNS